MAWGAMFHSPPCLSLAILQSTSFGRIGLEVDMSRTTSLSAGISRPVA